jgi:hypothetical protein
MWHAVGTQCRVHYKAIDVPVSNIWNYLNPKRICLIPRLIEFREEKSHMKVTFQIQINILFV